MARRVVSIAILFAVILTTATGDVPVPQGGNGVTQDSSAGVTQGNSVGLPLAAQNVTSRGATTDQSQNSNSQRNTGASSNQSPGKQKPCDTHTTNCTAKSLLRPASSKTNIPAKLLPLVKQINTMYPEIKGLLGPLAGSPSAQLSLLMTAAEKALSQLPQYVQSNLTTVLEALDELGITDLLISSAEKSLNATPKSQGPAATSYPFTGSWSKCQFDLLAMLKGVANSESWATSMIDATGKPGKSLTKGNLFLFGNNKQCTDVTHRDRTTMTTVQGRTCRTTISFDSEQSLTGDGKASLTWDVCLPDSCLDSDLNKALFDRGMKSAKFQCTADLDMTSDPGAIAAIIILVIFGLLIVVGSLVDIGLQFDSSNWQDDYVVSSKKPLVAVINHGFEYQESSFVDGRNQRKPPMVELPPEDNFASENAMHNQTYATTIRDIKHSDITRIPSTFPDFSGYRASRELIGDLPIPPRKVETSSQQFDENNLPKWQRFLLAFSLQRNTGKIMSIQANPGSIGCLHGIRVLSMGWVIFGHVYTTSIASGIFLNPLDIAAQLTTVQFQVIVNATLSVDTFFFMSGFLTCYLFLKECAKKRKVTCRQMVLYYVHRYWRLTPSFAIWIMIVATLIKYVGEGRPGWTDAYDAEACRENWWANLLYINNLYKGDVQCVGVSWFLANDMQFYILAPIVILPWVYRERIVGLIMALVLIGIHLASNVWLITKYDMDVMRNQATYLDKLYLKPYARVGPFAIGLIFGWILHLAKGKVKMNKLGVLLGWILALGLVLTISFVTYDENGDKAYAIHGWPAVDKAVYEALARPLWAVAIGWIVVACASGYGGFINSILAWPGFLPLSRLTYGVFLVHFSIIAFDLYGSLENSILFSHETMMYLFFCFFFMSYMVAFLLAVVVEAPMLALEKVVLKKK